MNRFWERLTLVDFLGFFIPGVVLLLPLLLFIDSQTMQKLLEISGNEWIFSLFFVLLAYIAGSFVSELSKILNWCFLYRWGGDPICLALKKGKKNHYSAEMQTLIKKLVKDRWGLSIEEDDQKIREAYGLIHIFVYKEGSYVKAQIFNGFFEMFRNLMMVFILLVLGGLIAFLLERIALGNYLVFLFFCAAAVWLSQSRALRFRLLAVRQIYGEFINLQSGETKKAQK